VDEDDGDERQAAQAIQSGESTHGTDGGGLYDVRA
jgi:hypothetical protein